MLLFSRWGKVTQHVLAIMHKSWSPFTQAGVQPLDSPSVWDQRENMDHDKFMDVLQWQLQGVPDISKVADLLCSQSWMTKAWKSS